MIPLCGRALGSGGCSASREKPRFRSRLPGLRGGLGLRGGSGQGLQHQHQLLPLLLWKGTVQGKEPDLIGGELLSGDGQVEQPVRRHPVEPQQGGQGLKVRLRDVVLIAGERFVVDAGEVHHLGLGQAPALPRQPQGVSEFFHSSDAPFAPILMQNRTIPLVILSKKENIIDFLKNRN